MEGNTWVDIHAHVTASDAIQSWDRQQNIKLRLQERIHAGLEHAQSATPSDGRNRSSSFGKSTTPSCKELRSPSSSRRAVKSRKRRVADHSTSSDGIDRVSIDMERSANICLDSNMRNDGTISQSSTWSFPESPVIRSPSRRSRVKGVDPSSPKAIAITSDSSSNIPLRMSQSSKISTATSANGADVINIATLENAILSGTPKKRTDASPRSSMSQEACSELPCSVVTTPSMKSNLSEPSTSAGGRTPSLISAKNVDSPKAVWTGDYDAEHVGNSAGSMKPYMVTKKTSSDTTGAEASASARYILNTLKEHPKLRGFSNHRGASDRELLESLASCKDLFATLRYEYGVDLDTTVKVLEELPKVLARLDVVPKYVSLKQREHYSRRFYMMGCTLAALALIVLFTSIIIIDAEKMAREGWHSGLCALAGFSNNMTGNSKCTSGCNFHVSIQDASKERTPSQVFEYDFMYSGWRPELGHDGLDGRMTWIGEPFRCCDASRTLNCCDFYDVVDDRFCDSWPTRKDQSGSSCPTGRWPCDFKIHEKGQNVIGLRLATQPMLNYFAPAAAVILFFTVCFWIYFLWHSRRQQIDTSITSIEASDVEDGRRDSSKERSTNGPCSPMGQMAGSRSIVDEPIAPHAEGDKSLEDVADDAKEGRASQELGSRSEPAALLRKQLAAHMASPALGTPTPFEMSPHANPR